MTKKAVQGWKQRMTGATAVCLFLGITLNTVSSQEAVPTISDIPSWLARTDVSIYADNNVILGEIETIQPLYQSSDTAHTIFFQGRGEYDSDKFTFNAGLGYRHLIPSGRWIFGMNAFYDIESEQYHQRIGAGFEAIGEQLTFRGNYYHGLTGWKTLTDTTTTKVETKPVDGFDLSLEGPLPHLPWLRAEASYFKWMPDASSDVDGFQGTLKAQISHMTSFEAGYRHDDNEDFVFGRLTFALGKPPEHEFTAMDEFISEAPFKPRDLRKHVLDKVERNNEIVLEKRVTNKSTGVVASGLSVSRGN